MIERPTLDRDDDARYSTEIRETWQADETIYQNARDFRCNHTHCERMRNTVDDLMVLNGMVEQFNPMPGARLTGTIPALAQNGQFTPTIAKHVPEVVVFSCHHPEAYGAQVFGNLRRRSFRKNLLKELKRRYPYYIAGTPRVWYEPDLAIMRADAEALMTAHRMRPSHIADELDIIIALMLLPAPWETVGRELLCSTAAGMATVKAHAPQRQRGPRGWQRGVLLDTNPYPRLVPEVKRK